MNSPRRIFISISIAFVLVWTALIATSCEKPNPAAQHKVLILGIDGMDFHIADRMIKAGKLPNFSRLANMGGFRPLISSIPAQSPVAWSNFITGMDPGGHCIFDFIHRDPKTMIPYLSTTKTESPKKFLSLLKYRVPIDEGVIELLRKGDAFWQILDRHGIPATIIKIPSNFPPAEFSGKSISGMGTPDILGTYGTFSYYTDNRPDNADRFSGGNCYDVWVEGNEVRADIEGPPNIFVNSDTPPVSKCPFSVFIDPEQDAAKIEVGDEEVVLNVGDWSRWVTVEFKMAPTVTTTGIVRFYLKEVRPDFKLYASPVNLDPLNPAMPISTPPDYAAKVAENVGLYYTQGMPQDTKALQYEVLSDEDYAKQSMIILDEEKRALDYELGTWKDGLLFYYFSTLDLNQHTWWRTMDSDSPMYSEDTAEEFHNFIHDLYASFDKILGQVLDDLDDETTLIVMSDHGFGPYNRQFNLNTWLLQNGYLELNDPSSQDTVEFLSDVDWYGTKAYGLGINGLYLNMRGREEKGIVDESEAEGLLREIAQKLEAIVDPKTGKHPIRKAYITRETFKNPDKNVAPDIIVGYERGYRGSDDSALGRFPEEVLSDNMDKWSGDHCIDPYALPGILFTNRKIKADMPHLYDLTINVLKEYNIEPPDNMIGKAAW